MKIITDLRTNEKNVLTSWRSPSDPALGSFTASIEPLELPQVVVWNGSDPYWRSGPWNGQIFIGIFDMEVYLYQNGFDMVNDNPGTAYLTFTHFNASVLTYFVLNVSGIIQQKLWFDGKSDWEVTWSSVESECDVYGKCGPYGSCNAKAVPICTCLPGFEPKNIDEWNAANWISGCMRKTSLQCETNNSVGKMGKQDGFLRLKTVKLPDHAKWFPALEADCGSQCLNSCSCIAYAYYSGIGCMRWTDSLIDVQKFSGGGGGDLYIRLAHLELDNKKDRTAIIATTIVLGFIMIAICTYFLLNWYRGSKQKCWRLLTRTRGTDPGHSKESLLNDYVNGVKLEEVPFFKFEMLSKATGNFDSAFKLGQGGFGPVYKGKLPSGQEVAVKRLGGSSNQGLQEFKNEVEVISKLQHRNLVRLLGCCVESEEIMLVYEYMPNRSLDAYLFDKQKLLDWNTRVAIIEGICRGLLYLHRDSRLRIIHRDLKASNILLDEELNPKISDFGLARIFGGKQDQANTTRVVGTFGYMAPEYALEGRFSEKSDVYSFGVLLLEIVSGRRNTSFYKDEQAQSLVAYAWKLWNEESMINLMDPLIFDPHVEPEILRYVHVGLLCVQEVAQDRPSISSILSMLSSEIVDLPHPEQPAFIVHRRSSETSPSKFSANDITVTIVDGRLAASRITRGQSIGDGETMISEGGRFALGFFGAQGSGSRYVGIWYKEVGNESVVWVANRERPVSGNGGVLTIGNDGNLMVMDGNGDVDLWHWQSFDHPTDTYLPNMNVYMDVRGEESHVFTSWKSAFDPSPGNYSMGIDPRWSPQIVIWEGANRRWRSGHWDGLTFTGINWEGIQRLESWADERKEWSFTQLHPADECDRYNHCGPFGKCNEMEVPKCSCMEGFVPKDTDQWSRENWSGGCVRQTNLQCMENNSLSVNKVNDDFVTAKNVKLPDFVDYVGREDIQQCQNMCLQNCSCTAYAFLDRIGCMIWYRDLVDVQKFQAEGSTLFIRRAHSELGDKSHVTKIVIITIVIAGFLLVCVSIWLLVKRKTKCSEILHKNEIPKVGPSGEFSTDCSGPYDLGVEGQQPTGTELAMFNFNHVAAATNNFSSTLPGGQEIAVKRLSRKSGQGLEEFKNEIMLIAKLQHRNLVRLLGCCIEGEEKMLLYEYMPNKSLDSYIFDTDKKAQLAWSKRFSIIEGIARGLVYLHRDSRLRIIHRDLKASNILLDEEMNPKISDFGMARIFGGNQNEANTNRVVGTYGYMAPEYAVDGLFSVKSDVFSFGVLVLEILSGKKNRGFYHPDHDLNLLGHAWKLWTEENPMDLLDASMVVPSAKSEVLRCIQIGLLCVQQRPEDRPTMPNVLLMLDSEHPVIAQPKQPGFYTQNEL
ncbi:UNVERIFIED_CONTAM: G-type lectin S-receptor-like serine/threonine-protein kinase [Sesamum calycinum]|uniref:non-specific serine/threonine protein kinase n=1 Tax=Sesamum calycinum TaxID=2727403 RepID=A0AAW2Q6M8_9LAMI